MADVADLDTNDETAVATGNTFRVESVTPGAAATELAFGRPPAIRLGVNWVSPGIVEAHHDTTGVVRASTTCCRSPRRMLGGTLSEPPPASVVDASSCRRGVRRGSARRRRPGGSRQRCGVSVRRWRAVRGRCGRHRSIDAIARPRPATIQVAGGRYAENVRLGSFDAPTCGPTLFRRIQRRLHPRRCSHQPDLIDGGGTIRVQLRGLSRHHRADGSCSPAASAQ